MNKLMTISLMVLSMLLCAVSYADGRVITYELDNQYYEGFYVNAGEKAPLVLLIHDWDGLTEYEIKRAKMLNDKG